MRSLEADRSLALTSCAFLSAATWLVAPSPPHHHHQAVCADLAHRGGARVSREQGTGSTELPCAARRTALLSHLCARDFGVNQLGLYTRVSVEMDPPSGLGRAS
eukprot:scaffold6725_cov117-Isochrysis_galbana.AAC.5